ncbi:MAG: hypothetical protein PHT32_07155, partial [Candidatus Omnitrophica bacterium]|nr:hypothetical protein [Candidatus Omnitrophota bacterium]
MVALTLSDGTRVELSDAKRINIADKRKAKAAVEAFGDIASDATKDTIKETLKGKNVTGEIVEPSSAAVPRAPTQPAMSADEIVEQLRTGTVTPELAAQLKTASRETRVAIFKTLISLLSADPDGQLKVNGMHALGQLILDLSTDDIVSALLGDESPAILMGGLGSLFRALAIGDRAILDKLMDVFTQAGRTGSITAQVVVLGLQRAMQQAIALTPEGSVNAKNRMPQPAVTKPAPVPTSTPRTVRDILSSNETTENKIKLLLATGNAADVVKALADIIGSGSSSIDLKIQALELLLRPELANANNKALSTLFAKMSLSFADLASSDEKKQEFCKLAVTLGIIFGDRFIIARLMDMAQGKGEGTGKSPFVLELRKAAIMLLARNIESLELHGGKSAAYIFIKLLDTLIKGKNPLADTAILALGNIIDSNASGSVMMAAMFVCVRKLSLEDYKDKLKPIIGNALRLGNVYAAMSLMAAGRGNEEFEGAAADGAQVRLRATDVLRDASLEELRNAADAMVILANSGPADMARAAKKFITENTAEKFKSDGILGRFGLALAFAIMENGGALKGATGAWAVSVLAGVLKMTKLLGLSDAAFNGLKLSACSLLILNAGLVKDTNIVRAAAAFINEKLKTGSALEIAQAKAAIFMIIRSGDLASSVMAQRFVMSLMKDGAVDIKFRLIAAGEVLLNAGGLFRNAFALLLTAISFMAATANEADVKDMVDARVMNLCVDALIKGGMIAGNSAAIEKGLLALARINSAFAIDLAKSLVASGSFGSAAPDVQARFMVAIFAMLGSHETTGGEGKSAAEACMKEIFANTGVSTEAKAMLASLVLRNEAGHGADVVAAANAAKDAMSAEDFSDIEMHIDTALRSTIAPNSTGSWADASKSAANRSTMPEIMRITIPGLPAGANVTALVKIVDGKVLLIGFEKDGSIIELPKQIALNGAGGSAVTAESQNLIAFIVKALAAGPGEKIAVEATALQALMARSEVRDLLLAIVGTNVQAGDSQAALTQLRKVSINLLASIVDTQIFTTANARSFVSSLGAILASADDAELHVTAVGALLAIVGAHTVSAVSKAIQADALALFVHVLGNDTLRNSLGATFTAMKDLIVTIMNGGNNASKQMQAIALMFVAGAQEGMFTNDQRTTAVAGLNSLDFGTLRQSGTLLARFLTSGNSAMQNFAVSVAKRLNESVATPAGTVKPLFGERARVGIAIEMIKVAGQPDVLPDTRNAIIDTLVGVIHDNPLKSTAESVMAAGALVSSSKVVGTIPNGASILRSAAEVILGGLSSSDVKDVARAQLSLTTLDGLVAMLFGDPSAIGASV